MVSGMIVAWGLGAVCATSLLAQERAGPAASVTVENVKFSSERIAMGGVLTVSCSVKGLKKDDWITFLVYAHGVEPVGRDGVKNPFVARGVPKVTHFKQLETVPLSYTANINLRDIEQEGKYDMYLYGRTPEFRLLVGSFDVDNSSLKLGGEPN